MSDPLQEIADLEAEIHALACAAEHCRKVIALSKLASGVGFLLLALILSGLIRLGPTALILAITSGLGGLALSGSHTTTLNEISARIGAHEARRAALIDAMALRTVGSG